MTHARIGRQCGAVLVTLALGACTTGGEPAPAVKTRTYPPSSNSSSLSSSPTSSVPTLAPTDEATAGAKPFCGTSLPAAWKRATVVDPWVVTMSISGSAKWSRPELRWVGADGSTAHIATVAGGLAMAWPVGNHVAFENLRSDQNWGDWELFLWDSSTRRKPVRLDESDGNVPNAPFLLVTTDDGHLAWLRPLMDGRREVRLHDVTTGKTRVVHVGHVGAPFIAGRLLVWPEAFAPNAPTRLIAVDLRTLKPAALPKQMNELRDPQEMSTDGRTYAWATKDRRRLMVWRQGWLSPRIIVENAEGNPVTWPKVSGDTVSWVDDRVYTADLRSGSYAPMNKQWGSADVWGRFLQIGLTKGSYHLDTSKLPPLPSCRS